MADDLPADPAKINIPLAENILLREHLFVRLDEARRRSVVFISAPAGSGKTTLVSSYIQERGIPCLWYQIDGGDADLATFFYYLGQAGGKFAAADHGGFPVFRPERACGIPGFSREFFSDIFSCLPSGAMLVFDDIQEAGEASSLHQALFAALDRIPRNITMLLLSRSGPPAQFSRLLANRNGTQLSWEDLRFSLDEFRDIASTWQGKGRPAVPLEDLHMKMDGWIAGLHLMSKLEFQGYLLDIADNSPQEIFDYFSLEAFSRFEEPLQNFLMKSAFLSPLSVSMAEKISNDHNAGSFLEGLHRNNYFTNKRWQSEVVYNFHPLFRDFLVQQAAERLSAEEFSAFLQTAVGLLLEAHRFQEAVDLLCRIADWDRLVTLILEHASLMLEHGRNMTLLKWLDFLPPSTLAADPYLLYWQGLGLQPYDQPEALVSLKASFHLLTGCKDSSGALLVWSAIVNTYALEWNDFTTLDDWIDWFEENCHAGNTSSTLHAAMSIMQSLMIRRPQHPEMSHWISVVLSLVKRNEGRRQEVQALCFVINYYIWMGDYHRAESLLWDMRRLADASHSNPLILLTHSWLAAGLRLWNRPLHRSKARELLDDSLAVADESGIHVWDHMFYALHVNRLLIEGDFKQAEEYLDKIAKTLAPEKKHGYCHYHYLRAWNDFRQNNFTRAEWHNQTALKVGRETGYVFPVLLCLLEASHISCELKQYDKALGYVEEAQNTNKSIQSHIFEFMLLLSKAKILYGMGDEIQGNKALTKALTLGHRQQFFSLLWWSDPVGMEMLCTKALQENIEVGYVRKYIRKMGVLPLSATPVENWPWPVRIYTLGRFELVVNDSPVRFSGRAQQRPLDLLKALIALGGREVGEGKINDALWPDADGDLQHQNFTATLHRLRKLLGIKDALIFNNGSLTLDNQYCWVDVWAFERLLGQAEHAARKKDDPVQAARLTSQALLLYKGRFLDNSHDFWSVRLQERCRSRCLGAMEKMGRYHEHAGRLTEAIEAYLKALELDPLVERFYRRLMECQSRAGNIAEALATYRRCTEVLARGLLVEPSAQTRELYLRISGR